MKAFPFDPDTIWIIKEIEIYLELKNKEIDKMKYNELTHYIEQLTLMLLK